MSTSSSFVARSGAAFAKAGWLVAGVLLPAAALATELSTRMCAEMLFDPLWTPTHVVLVAAVPVAHLWLWLWWTGRVPMPLAAGFAAGLAFTVSAYYALIFLPLTPLAVVGILFFGLGLLALAPLASAVTGLLVCRLVRRHSVRWRSLAAGGLAAALVLVGAEVPGLAQMLWSSWAASPDVATRAKGIALLRSWGDRDALLESCYRGDSVPGFLPRLRAGFAEPIGTTAAREVYFRVTGEPFDQRPRPALRTWREDFDEAQGGREVGGKVRGLSLSSSRFDSSIDANAAIGYTEWTLVIRNADPVMRSEARAEIALPEGAVVSRATLWIQGEPREAAFAGAGEARAAYASVVQQSRDPLLVTQPSPGRVLVQCFPVEPRSEMKIRIGISFPLTPIGDHRTRFTLPFFTDHNFELADDLAHHVWVEATGKIDASHASLKPEHEGTRLRGALPAAQLAGLSMQVAWPGPLTHFALEEPAPGASPTAPPQPAAVIQNFRQKATSPLRHLVVVVDTSQALAAHADALVELLAANRLPLTLVLPTDAQPELQRIHETGLPRRARLVELLKTPRFVGGRDNVPALRAGLEQARAHGADALLWLHGPQPLVLSSSDVLTQQLERDEHAPDIVPIGFGAGTNRILHELGNDPAIRPPSWRGSSLATLAGYLDARTAVSTIWSVERTRLEAPPELPVSSKTSAHLVRLWAADRVAGGCDGLAREACVALAASHQLVTAVSGAVVLESAAQYDAANLKPVDAATIPSIPEPETWLLLCVALIVLLGADRLARSQRALRTAP